MQKYTYFAGNFDHFGDAAVQCRAHHLMEHILGFTRSHWMPLLGKCLRRIAPAATKVIELAANTKHYQITTLASNLQFNEPRQAREFHTPKWTLY